MLVPVDWGREGFTGFKDLRSKAWRQRAFYYYYSFHRGEIFNNNI
jgi:hypothetical protein